MSASHRATNTRLATNTLVQYLGKWTTDEGPLYRQLSEAVATLVATGVLRADDRLPSERSLAAALHVSRGTVVAAYDALAGDGRVVREQGRGTTVVGGTAAVRTREPLHGDGLFRPSQTSIDLLKSIPAPIPRVLEILGAMDWTVDIDALASAEPAGIPALRAAIARRLTSEGHDTRPEEVVVTSGAQQAMSLIIDLLVQPGDVVLTEDTTWPGVADNVRRIGGQVVGVRCDDHGIITDELAAAIARFRPVAVCLNPHQHNPTGSRLPTERRQAVADLLADYQVTLIEDRVSARLAFDRYVPPPLMVQNPRCRSVVVDSINKVAWAGLRIGWARTDPQTANDIRSARALHDMFSAIPPQLVAVAVLDELDGILQERVDGLARSAALLCDRLATRLPDWEVPTIRGGMVAWVRLPGGRGSAFADFAKRFGVAVASGHEFAASTVDDDHIRVPFTMADDVLVEAVERLARAWAAFVTTPDTAGGRQRVV